MSYYGNQGPPGPAGPDSIEAAIRFTIAAGVITTTASKGCSVAYIGVGQYRVTLVTPMAPAVRNIQIFSNASIPFHMITVDETLGDSVFDLYPLNNGGASVDETVVRILVMRN